MCLIWSLLPFKRNVKIWFNLNWSYTSCQIEPPSFKVIFWAIKSIAILIWSQWFTNHPLTCPRAFPSLLSPWLAWILSLPNRTPRTQKKSAVQFSGDHCSTRVNLDGRVAFGVMCVSYVWPSICCFTYWRCLYNDLDMHWVHMWWPW